MRWGGIICLLFCGLLSQLPAYSQEEKEISGINRFLTPSEEYNPKRLGGVVGTMGVLYTTAAVGLYQYWYKDFPLTYFHFFNDNEEWLQMDKGGHIYNTYFQSYWTSQLYRWAGVDNNKAYWYGALTGSVYQLTIEVYDAFSEKWGFSTGDLLANTLGAGLMLGQGLLWDEQKIWIKASYFPPSHPDDLQERADNLFGTSFSERVLKDYNGLTYWLSVAPGAFFKRERKFPPWLAFSFGYGAEGLYGGFENKWCSESETWLDDCPEDLIIDRSDVERIRQYYLSLDIDLTRIPTESRVLKTLFGIFNIIKIPAPALELNSKGDFTFHWIYF